MHTTKILLNFKLKIINLQVNFPCRLAWKSIGIAIGCIKEEMRSVKYASVKDINPKATKANGGGLVYDIDDDFQRCLVD